MGRHVNIPIFIPHLGCPNQCVFCNQRLISGRISFDEASVKQEIDTALSTVTSDDEVEIAFFGGSFTGIDRNLMIRLLELAQGYLVRGLVGSIRCSTRPDYIDGEILEILSRYGVRAIELGLQSTCDRVLTLSKRGHSLEDEIRACRLIRNMGFELVGQMMIGLPGSTAEDEVQTARNIVKWGCSAVRIYPTVVFKDTELCGMCENGEYSALTLEEAVERGAEVLKIFSDSSLSILRIGLCSSDNLSSADCYFAGPNHPAIGELIEGKLYYDKICERLSDIPCEGKHLVINAPLKETSKIIGQKRIYKEKLTRRFGLKSIKVIEDARLEKYNILISFKEKNSD